MAVLEYTKTEVKEFAAHLKTMGAYVQAPNPKVVGLSNFQVIGSQDAKSLYPTIMVLLNIGYDTLRGRIYDYRIVGKLFEMMKYVHSIKDTDEAALAIAISNFKGAIRQHAKSYANRNDVKKSKKEFISFTAEYYGEAFRKIVSYEGEFKDILKPNSDETYHLLKSALYPLFEAMTWISAFNLGYSDIVVDHVFFNDKFEEKYKNKKFIVFHNINSVHTEVLELNYDEFTTQITPNYILNPYGTYFDKHDDNKSFEVDLILGAMDDRAYVKNQMLIVGAITENWSKLSTLQQASFILKDEFLNPTIAEEIVELVGDSDPKVREWQLKNLMSIKFDTSVTEEKIKGRLELFEAQRDSKSNGIKVTLNSGYGIYGMSTWVYGNNLIANSITSGGKIYGIKLFQQVASNKLKVERQKNC